jgi:hypothetical protein
MMAKHRRGRTGDSFPVDPLPLSLDDVYLLTAESGGEQAVNGLALVVDHNGLTVFGPSGSAAAAMTWSELTVLRTVGRTTTPLGEGAVVLEAATTARTHRFSVPTGDAVALEATIAAITGVPAADPPRRTRRRQ